MKFDKLSYTDFEGMKLKIEELFDDVKAKKISPATAIATLERILFDEDD